MPSRRYDLDWLRVFVFAILIFYHIGMLYVADWGFHIKSEYSSESLKSLMLLVNPWRMPILWLISGIAIRFILAKVSLLRFISMRSIRLLLPLLFAILVIVPPQLYYEMTFNGDLNISYWEFYTIFFDSDHPVFKNYQPGIWPHIDVNHLWYLRELWSFSLFLIPILPLLNSQFVENFLQWLSKQNSVVVFIILVSPIFTIQIAMEDTKDSLGFLFLIYGYLLGWNKNLWQRLRKNYAKLLLVSIACYILFVGFYYLVWAKSNTHAHPLLLLAGGFIYSLDRLVWVLAILGISSQFLNKKSAKLSYFSEAVYPYYIVHQTIIIIAGFELSKFHLGAIIEPVSIIIITLVGCMLSFEIIRRVEILRPLFGLKLKNNYSSRVQKIGYCLHALILIPLGLEILI